MKTFYLNDSLTDIKKINEDVALCLGDFDGVHLGHRKIIFEARKSDYKTAIITFNNLNKHEGILTSIEDRLNIFKSLSVDYVYVINFNDYIKSLSKEKFKEKFVDVIKPKLIIAGADFKFGNNLDGDLDYLSKFYECKKIDLYCYKNNKISTTLIIDLLKEGNVELANQLLGKEFEIKGKIVEGFKLGRTINFPTANIDNLTGYIVPKFGVYESIIYVRGIPYLSITNVGIHPTINKLNKPGYETHILNFDEDIYGETVYLKILRFIRGEKKFTSKEELKKQIKIDIDKLRKI